MGNEESVGSGSREQTIPGWGSVEFGRRLGLKALGATALVGGVAALAEASAAAAATKSGTIKIGYVTPSTGALADFAGPDKFVLSLVRASSQYAKGITIGKTKYKIEIIVKNSQSDPSIAGQVATELIQSSGVDLIVTSSAPETTIPVSAVCEGAGVPCLSTVCPWEAWWGGFTGNSIGPAGNAVGTSPQFCSMFFFGVPEFVECFLPMWNKVLKQTSANQVFAGMFPNDSDGNAFRAAWPPTLNAIVGAEKGTPWTFVDGGAYTDLTSDYTNMISTFKTGSGGKSCDFFINCPLPPDFNTFWKQASQQNWNPKLATVAKVMLFPTDVYALGDLSNNVATDAWFTPNSPYKSSLTGMTANTFAANYQKVTKQQWVQSMGSTYSLFEIVIQALKKVHNPHDRKAVAAAFKTVNYDGMCGPLNFSAKTNPAKGIGIIKPVGIQWKPGSTELVGHKKFSWSPWVVDNTLNKQIPTQATLEPTNA
ncbi:MAG TPA: ABC transporter substrate-binding protein [Acidimicrobiales bacterium]